MKTVFKFIKASQFFPKYCSGVVNWKHKLRGYDSNKKPLDFSKEEKAQIKQGLKQMLKDLINSFI